MEIKRKSPAQLQVLEHFYRGEKYPTTEDMNKLAEELDLTFGQVRGWFIEKRRREKSNYGFMQPPPSRKKLSGGKVRNGLGVSHGSGKVHKLVDISTRDRAKSVANLYAKYRSGSLVVKDRVGKKKKKKKVTFYQNLLAPEYIIGRIFRKDGPPLGTEFDSLPSRAFHSCRGFGYSPPACEEAPRASKRRKDCNDSVPVKKHGMGKGLMTVWRATNPDGGDFPPSFHFTDRGVTDISEVSTSVSRKPQRQTKKRRETVSTLIRRRLENKLQEKKKPPMKRLQVVSRSDEIENHLRKEKCDLALEEAICQDLSRFALLMDDEDLERRELRAGPHPLTCSDHCATNGPFGCSLCKDLLAKFPPNSVKMKQPFTMQPWDSSPETVKKLFKVFHFLYTFSVKIEICPFTLDEFAQAFHDKDSFLLGKVHVALLNLLLSDVEAEISKEFPPPSSVSCKFLALLHSVEHQEFLLEFWKNSLNPLTWAEILRQVLVAAGFGSKHGTSKRETLSKEMSLMVKYGLRRGTLKGELFRLLLEKGNKGSKTSELAKSLEITELNLASTPEEVEHQICSTLSSDITLFEKISCSAYRLRMNTITIEGGDSQSDSEDSGSVHDEFGDGDLCNISDSECDSEIFNPRGVKRCRSKNGRLRVRNEIDESHPGEVWLLGLMEGEYSDLTIDEKLNALAALTDLLSAGSSIRVEDSAARLASESVSNMHRHSSGGKIKKALSNQNNLTGPSWVHALAVNDKGAHASSEFRPLDSSISILRYNGEDSRKEKGAKDMDFGINLHSMQSIFLGSDRRYNRYWLFLGPCNSHDPGHKRIYFESSEDGHWKVIDTQEALRALLSVLDDRGRREAVLIESLEKRETFLCQEMSSKSQNYNDQRQLAQLVQSGMVIVGEESSSPVSDVDNNSSQTDITNDSLPLCGAITLESGKKREEENKKWYRLQQFDLWIWNSFYRNLHAVKNSKRSYLESLARCEVCHDLYWRDEKHCKICHTTFELDFDLEEKYAIHLATCGDKGDEEMFHKHKILPSQLQALKAAIHAIEAVMPENALVGAWRKSAHRLWVKRLRRTSSLSELLRVVADFVAAVNQDWLNAVQDSNMFMEELVACFPTMPQTSSALALWLVKLDDLIAPHLQTFQCAKKKNTRNKCTGVLALE